MGMARVSLATVVLTVILTAWPGPARAMDEIVLNTGIRDPFTTTDKNGFIDLLLAEIFRRIGIKVDIIVYQDSDKSLDNSNQGIDDGVALRIEGLEEKFPNLIRVPEKLMDNDFVAYSTGRDVVTDTWQSMDGYRIAYINGWQIFQNNLMDHAATTKTRNAQDMLDLLTQDQVDFILYERWQGLWRAQQLGLSIKVHEPPLTQREMFMYLNKKHADLVDKAAAALKAMKKDGTYQNIFDETLGLLLH